MHLLIIFTAMAIAWGLRSQWTQQQQNWVKRWRYTLFYFLYPPLLLLMTVIAVLCMGPQGSMMGFHAGYFSYILAITCLVITAFLCLKGAFQGWKSLQSARSCLYISLQGKTARILNTEALFAGQIGFWQPELVISQGLINSLDSEHLETVIAHEQGHYYYRDTFWFFWLGLVRECTAWLPHSQALWEELLLLREIRADNWAATQVDPLLLAESLLMVVSTPSVLSESFCAGLNSGGGKERLEERIDAILTQPQPIPKISWGYLHKFGLALLPLVTVLMHQ